MKKSIVYSVVVIILIASVFACGSGNGSSSDNAAAAADPADTITTSVNYTANDTPIELYAGLADDGPYTDQGRTYPYVIISFGINSSLNFAFHTAEAEYLGTHTNPYWNGLGSYGGEVAHVGQVTGLGDVTEKPSSGWSTTVAVEVGHGYVVRFKKSKNYSTANLPYVYARVYVVENLISSTSGGVIGAKIKYQTPF
jgi:hypothetical protein